MSTSSLCLSAVRRGLALAVVAGSTWVIAGAQTPAADNTPQAGTVRFENPLPMADATSAALLSSSSSSSSLDDATGASGVANQNLASLEKNFAVPDMHEQYGRRRYGATRYRGSNTNADGSEKWEGYAGAGFGTPITNNSNYLTTGWGFQVGGGRNFNRHFGVNLEFDYDHFGLNSTTLNNQAIYYFCAPGTPVSSCSGASAYGLDGNTHIWNFSIQPVYQVYSGQGLGAYLTGGVGFYHKVANFTLPQEEEYCDPFYGCGEIEVNGTIDHYTSNAPGFDGGVGLTYKFSRFANERLFAEVRYVYVDNSYRPGISATNYDSTTNPYLGNNYFPQNSQTTTYIPIKFGLRF